MCIGRRHCDKCVAVSDRHVRNNQTSSLEGFSELAWLEHHGVCVVNVCARKVQLTSCSNLSVRAHCRRVILNHSISIFPPDKHSAEAMGDREDVSMKKLRKAVMGKDVGVVRALLRVNPGGLNVLSSSGKNLLHLSAWRGPLPIVELLLDKEADINAVSTGIHNYGKSAIFYAVTRSFPAHTHGTHQHTPRSLLGHFSE